MSRRLVDAFLLAFFKTYCALCNLLMLLHRRTGLPSRAVDLPRAFLPDTLMHAAARAYFRDLEQRRVAAGDPK